MQHWHALHADSQRSSERILCAALAPYMRRNKMKIGDVIAITRRPDAQLVSRHEH